MHMLIPLTDTQRQEPETVTEDAALEGSNILVWFGNNSNMYF